MSAEKNDEVEPSIAFCGIPAPSVEICIGAFPAATLRTVKSNKRRRNEMIVKIVKTPPFEWNEIQRAKFISRISLTGCLNLFRYFLSPLNVYEISFQVHDQAVAFDL